MSDDAIRDALKGQEAAAFTRGQMDEFWKYFGFGSSRPNAQLITRVHENNKATRDAITVWLKYVPDSEWTNGLTIVAPNGSRYLVGTPLIQQQHASRMTPPLRCLTAGSKERWAKENIREVHLSAERRLRDAGATEVRVATSVEPVEPMSDRSAKRAQFLDDGSFVGHPPSIDPEWAAAQLRAWGVSNI